MQVQICGFLWTQNRKGISHHAVFGQFVCYFSVTVINVYWSMDAVIIWCVYG